jgi:hypothetical protein
MMRVQAEDAKGPTYGRCGLRPRCLCMDKAVGGHGLRDGIRLTHLLLFCRYLQGKLLRDEEFCMQIDAHMDFEDLWDKRLMEMWGASSVGAGHLSRVCPILGDVDS